MKVYSKLYKLKEKTSVILGNFDGIHLGHKELLSIAKKKSEKLPLVLLTFKNHPIQYFKKLDEYKFLTTLEEKIELLKDTIDILFVVDFNKNIADLSYIEFINEIIVKKLNAKIVTTGFNYRFGKNKAGNINLLKILLTKNNIKLNICEKIMHHNKVVSASLVKIYLGNGNIEKANQLLGHEYILQGNIISGNAVGESILGFPTANIEVENKFLPLNGVYGVELEIDNESNLYYGVLNIGHNPTFNFKNFRSVEVFILNFSENIYGKFIKIKFLNFLRKEIKFSTIEKLKTAIKNDVKNFQEFLDGEKI